MSDKDIKWRQTIEKNEDISGSRHSDTQYY